MDIQMALSLPRDVVSVPDAEKTDALKAWGASVWASWKGDEERIRAMLNTHLKKFSKFDRKFYEGAPSSN